MSQHGERSSRLDAIERDLLELSFENLRTEMARRKRQVFGKQLVPTLSLGSRLASLDAHCRESLRRSQRFLLDLFEQNEQSESMGGEREEQCGVFFSRKWNVSIWS